MRSISDAMRTALFSENAKDITLCLLRIIDHYAPNTVLARLVNDTVAVRSGGYDYVPTPFSINFPTDTGQDLPTLPLTIDNVDEAYSELACSLVKPVDIEFEFCLACTPEIIEMGPWRFTARSVTVTDATIELELQYEDLLNQAFPCLHLTPNAFPGLFGTVNSSNV